MKKIFIPMLLAIVAFTICSCSKEEKIIAPTSNSGNEVSFSAAIGEDQQTKTTFNDRSLKLFWKSNDKVHIWHKEANSLGTYKASADGAQTNLVLDSGSPLQWVAGTNTFSSVYVCNTSLTHSDDYFTISLPKDQTQSQANNTDHFGSYMAMKGFLSTTHTGTEPVSNVDIPFKPLYSVLEFSFPYDATKKVTKVEAEITSGSDQVLAFETANVSKNDNSTEITNTTTPSNKVTLTFTTQMDLSKGISKGWMIVKPGTYDNIKFTYTYESGAPYTKNYSNVTIERGTRYRLTTYNNIIHNTANATENTVNTLENAIETQLLIDNLNTITSLKITGTMNQADFETLKNDMPLLTTLDLSEVTIVGTINIRFDSETNQYQTQDGNAIPYEAFKSNTKIKSIVFPKNITTIGERAFSGCTGLTGNITIPKGVTTIEKRAFNRCSGFDGNLIIPEGVTTIGEGSFYYCSGLTGSLTIPEDVTTIEDLTFCGCSGLTRNLIIPEGVTAIGKYAFYGCTGINGTLTIPSTVTTIEDWAFYGCSGINGTLTIPSTVTTIGICAFYNCSGFTGNLTIPEGVTFIGFFAFKDCSGFNGTLTIPSTVTTIEDWAFCGCSGFNGTLTIPSTVTTIEDWAFCGCSGFNGNLTIPEGVTTIGIRAFDSCSGLTGSLTIPEDVTTIENAAFSGCSGFNGNLTIPEGVETIRRSAFFGCSHLTGNLIIPERVTTIEEGAFYGCSGFNGTLTIPSTVTTIDTATFWGCSGLNGNLTIPEGVETIRSNAFYGCSGFDGNLIIPEGVTTIEKSAFSNCSGINGTLTIPEGVTTIQENAFAGCDRFTSLSLNYTGETGSELPSYELYMFPSQFTNSYTGTKGIVTVPVGSKSIYMSKDGWKDLNIPQAN